MKFKEYEEAAKSTALYPESGTGSFKALSYVGLKMNGEAGEFAEHLGKAMRDDAEITEHRRELLIKEIGDVLWYLAAASRELKTTLEEVANVNVAKLKKRYEENKIKGSGDER